MKRRIAPVLEIQVDITQPTRCIIQCPFFTAGLLTYKDSFCRLFHKRLQVVKARGKFSKDIVYIHRCRQCRTTEIK